MITSYGPEKSSIKLNITGRQFIAVSENPKVIKEVKKERKVKKNGKRKNAV